MATNSSNVQDVRDRIIKLAREIEGFSKSDMPPNSFFDEFLKRVVGAVGARAGAIWLQNENRQLQLFCERQLESTGFHEDPRAAMRNQKLLLDVLSNGQACTHSPNDTNDVELPTNDLLILAALMRNKDCVGVVEIFQRIDTPAQARPGFLQFVEQMCGYACRYLENQAQSPSDAASTQIADKFETFALQIHRSLDVAEVTTTAANDGRLLTDCDRFSVAVQYNNKTKIEAISGQDSVNQRANLVRTMTSLTSKVIRSGKTMRFTGKVDQLQDELEEPLADYIQESGSRMVIVVPLFKVDNDFVRDKVQSESSDEKAASNSRPKPVGAIVIEQVSESQPSPGLEDRIELISDHVAAAVTNARRHQRLFLMPIWIRLGRIIDWFDSRNSAIGVAIVLLLIAAGICLVVVPMEYRVEGNGRLTPVVQRDVFAPSDGDVIAIYVKSKQRVQAGDKLLKLRNDQLKEQLLRVESQKHEKTKQLLTLRAEFDRARAENRDQEAVKLEGQMTQAQIELVGIEQQEAMLIERVKELTVIAPISGVVATFQLEQLLMNRPVRRGEILLEIKDDTGDWRLELEIDEHRMGHILEAQKAARIKAKEAAELEADIAAKNNPENPKSKEQIEAEIAEKVAESEHIPVEFQLATDAERTRIGQLEKISPRANTSEDKSNVIEIFVAIDSKNITNRRIGAEVRAKINCGQRPLGIVLFGDIVEFVQTHVWIGSVKAETAAADTKD